MNTHILKCILAAALCLQPGRARGQEAPLFITDYLGVLYSLNMAGCTLHRFGAIEPLADLAFTPNGRLWGIVPDTVGGSLYLVDTAGVRASYKGRTPIYGNSLVALNDSILLMVYDRDLYGIRVRDASTYRIGNIRYPSMGDLAWYGRDLYLAAADTLLSAGLLVKIVLNDTYDAVLSSTALNTRENPTPEFFGLATITLPGSGPSLVGFSRYGAYKLNTQNASYQPLCDSLPVALGVSGAAYIGSPPGGTGIDPGPLKLRLNLYPNPARNEVQVQLDNFNGTAAELSLCLYDYTGRLMMCRSLTATSETISLGGYSTGLYIIRLVYQGNTVAVEKLVRE